MDDDVGTRKLETTAANALSATHVFEAGRWDPGAGRNACVRSSSTHGMGLRAQGVSVTNLVTWMVSPPQWSITHVSKLSKYHMIENSLQTGSQHTLPRKWTDKEDHLLD